MHRSESSGRRVGWMSIGRVGALVALALAVVAASGVASADHARLPPAATSRTGSAVPAASAPAASSNNSTGPCIFVTTLVCVGLYNPADPNIIPAAGSSNSAVDPEASSTIQLVVKSETGINWSGAPQSGPNCPVALNVTGTLWNGAPYYSLYDGSTWHSASSSSYYLGPLAGVTNKTYPYWYVVTISPTGTGGQQLFFPGMSITWWIALTYNDSGAISHVDNTPRYTFTYSGAWPWSPDPGARQYAGSAAFSQDLNLAQVPSAPNWNDSVRVTVNTTSDDVGVNATIGSATLKLTEATQNGSSIAVTSYEIPQTKNATGALSVYFEIPASLALRPNATVHYQVIVGDYWGDLLDSRTYGYTVGGNGSFTSGDFSTDLTLVSSPNVGASTAAWNGTLLAPGVPILLNLTSNNAPTAINAAEVVYTVTLPEIGTTVVRSAPFERVNSTFFTGGIPAMPVGAEVNFTVLAWDFHSTLERASGWNYTVESFDQIVPPSTLPANQTFFYVGVYDAGNGHWVSGASVGIRTAGGFFRSVGTTYDGLAYPNATNAPFQPLVVPANATYIVNVTDPTFDPVGGAKGAAVQVSLLLTHTLTGHRVIVSSATYSVVQQGDLLLFYLNGTLPSPTAASPETSTLVVGAVVGLIAAAVTVIPLYLWWSRIVARRESELKRVTL